MTNKETIEKNIELTFDFVRHLIDNPHLINDLPDKCEIDFIEKDFSSRTEKELKYTRLIKVSHNFKMMSH